MRSRIVPFVCAVLLSLTRLTTGAEAPLRVEAPRDGRCPVTFHWRVNPPTDKALGQLHAKDDAFEEEAVHESLRPRIDALRLRLLSAPATAVDLTAFLAPGFKGTRLTPSAEDAIKKSGGFELYRARATSTDAGLGAPAFAAELATWLADYGRIAAADLDVVDVSLSGPAKATATLLVDFDVVGTGRGVARVQKIGQWRQTWTRGTAGSWRLVKWEAVSQTRSQATRAIFTDATEPALGGVPAFEQQLRYGADHWRRLMDKVLAPDVSSHAGIAAGDADGDGLDDLYVSQPSGLPNRLFRNQGDGTFADVTDASGLGLLDATPMSIFADVDNDADQDLVVVTWTQPLLFLNDGQSHFTLRRGAFQFNRPPEGTLITASLADFDRDGFLDLYLGTYNYFVGRSEASLPTPYHDAQNAPPKFLFRGDGQGRFVDVTEGSGIDQRNDRYSLAPAWADYDGDGWIDLYVANDFGRHNLYRNLGVKDGRVRFEEVGAAAGVEDIGAGMSSSWFDYDNDGRLDLYVANMWSSAGQRLTRLPNFQPEAPAEVLAQMQRHAKGNTLFRNRGDGTFEDATVSSRTNKARWAWASDALDFDNDGWEDIYSTNGMITNPDPNPALGDLDSFYWRRVVGQSPLTKTPAPVFEDSWTALIKLLAGRGEQAAHERNVFFHNGGDGTFVNVEGALGLDLDQDARALALSDFDQDGDTDVFVKSRTGPQVRYLRNDMESGNASVAFRLIGTRSNRDAVGAIVRVETEHGRYMKVVPCGSQYLSERSKELLFGLGAATKIQAVTIAWPSGAQQALEDVPIGHRLTVTEGDEAFSSVPFRKAASAPAPPATVATAVAAPSSFPGTWIYQGYPAPDFSAATLDGTEQTLTSQAGHPVFLHFWSTECAPCAAGLRALQKAAPDVQAAGATVWTLAVDGPEARARALTFVRKERLTLPVLLPDADVTGIYSLLHRHLYDYAEDMSLPVTFLIDAQGLIAKVYKGPVAEASLASDVADLDAPVASRLARALPFAGEFLAPIKARSDFQIGMELAGHGFDEPALIAFERAAATAPDALTYYNLGTIYMRHGQRARAEVSLRRALSQQHEYPEAQNSLGVLLAQRERFDEAIAQFRAALEGRPGFADAMNNLGYTLLQMEKVEEALALFEEAIRVQPEFPEAYNNLGIFWGQEGDLAKAAGFFQKAVSQRPTYSEAVNNLAMVYAAQGRRPEAVAMLERCVAADPTFSMSYVVLARILFESGQHAEGMKVLQRLLERDPKNEAGLRMLQQARAATPQSSR